jgi:outer membrane protein assembly factor BamB
MNAASWLRPICAWSFVVALLLPADACAADWPQWGGGQQRNMASAEKGLPTTFDPGRKRRDHLGFDPETSKNVQWMVRLGTENYSSPTIARGRVYIGANDEALDDPRFEPTRGGVLKCLDESSGNLLWQLVVPRLKIDRSKVSQDFDDMNLGICSTATVDEGRVYIVSNRCEVICLDVDGLTDGNDGPFTEEAKFSVDDDDPPVQLGARDADILWRFDMIRDLPIFPHDAANCSVLVVGDYVYVGTSNGVYDGKVVLPSAPSLIVLNKHTGKLIARDESGISPQVFHGQWSSPSLGKIGERELFFYGGGDGVCYAFETFLKDPATPALKEVWRFDANPPHYRQREGQPIDYWALARGAKKDEFRGDGTLISPNEIIATPVLYEKRLYVTIGQDPLHGRGRGALSCIDPAGTGDISKSNCLWQYTDLGRSMSTVSIADGLVYVAETWGKIHCLDAKTGEVQWVFDTADEIWSSTLVADGKVYVGTRHGLTVLAAGRTRKHLAEIKLGSPVWSVPAAANGVLYVASQKNLFAVKDKGQMPQP